MLHIFVAASRRLAIAAVVVIALASGGVVTALQQSQVDQVVLPPSDTATPATSGRIAVVVELQAEPGAVAFGRVIERAGGRPSAEMMQAAVAAGRTQIAAVLAEQAQVGAYMAGPAVNAAELYRARRAMNAIAATVDASSLAALRRRPGVKAVHILEPEYPTNATSVPFLGTPQVWANTLGLPAGATGQGIRVGVIDTGIDYQHATFGGTGLLADYQANDRAAAPDAFFPSAKVVGGWDFVGDAYNGGNTPQPDPDPMDCNGHGTHVAGTAAGYGVTAAGTTFPGPYTVSAPYGSLRIGPGTAPHASLYALRVFGCGGSTNVTVAAIDWAMDPNGDNDLSDRLDVINMSLGSSFGSLTSASAIAADNAAAAGVIVVASAGNSGDTFFISGSPGSGNRVLATAATYDGGLTGTSLRVNAPSALAGIYTVGISTSFGGAPPSAGLSGDVELALDPADVDGPLTTDACSALTNAAAIAGKIALVDRGTCGFAVKAKMAQDAGAIAVIVANTSAGAFGNLGGTDPAVVIPAVMVTFSAGNSFKADIADLNVTLFSAGDTIGSFSSRGPRRSGSGAFALKPDIAAPGVAITSAQTGVTCTGSTTTGCQVTSGNGYIDGSAALTLNGTSMAAPHVAGIMALLRQLHPTWTVEELKALAMNTAIHDVTTLPGGLGDRYGAGRVGAGRVDPAAAAASPVVAFNADDPNVVSLSFELSEVVGAGTQTKTLRIVNQGTTPQTYDLALDTVVDAPGVEFELDTTSVTIPPGQTRLVSLEVNADAAAMDHTRDPAIATTQAVTSPIGLADLPIPRHWLTEETGYVTLSQSGSLKLRVPFYLATRPASTMSAPATITTSGAPTGSTTIPLNGQEVCTGTPGPTCPGSGPLDTSSRVTPFELQVVSPRDPTLEPYQDLQYAGVMRDSARIFFGVSTWGAWLTPTDVAFNIYVDNDLNGSWDRVIVNSNSGALARVYFGQSGQGDTDTALVFVFTPPGSVSLLLAPSVPNFVNAQAPDAVDTALFNSNVMFLGATPGQLGLATVNTPFRYRIETCPASAPLCQSLHGFHLDEAIGPYFWNGAAPGLSFNSAILAQDLAGAALPVIWNTANLTTNGSLGALLLHHHNVAGQQAQVVLLDTAQRSDLGITLTAAPATPAMGQQVTFTATVSNTGPNNATGVTVDLPLPSGVTFVSTDGAYDETIGVWTIGALANGASAALHIVATADVAGPIRAEAVITGGMPLDPTPANNRAVSGLSAAAQADLLTTAVAASPTIPFGSPASFTVTVTNNGGDTAYGVTATQTLTGGTIQTGTPSTGVFTPGTGAWEIASLPAGASATLTLTAVGTGGALLQLQSAVSSSVADPSAANNTAAASATVLALPTVTTAANATVTYSPLPQTVELTATVTSTGGTVNEGIVTFTLRDAENDVIGTPGSVPVVNGAAALTAGIPAGTPAQTLTLTAAYTGTATFANSSDATKTVTILPSAVLTYLLAEGATGPFFDLDIVIANPNAQAAPVTLTFFKEDGHTVEIARTLDPTSRTTIRVDDLGGLEGTNASTLVSSTDGLPLIVERTMWWGDGSYGSHSEKAIDMPSTTWYFAEGSQGTFATFLLLANPQVTANTAHVTWYREGEPVLLRDYPLLPTSRTTIDAGLDPELVGRMFGAKVVFDEPGMAERAMYFGRSPLWAGGTASAGVTAPSTNWYFAEGATGSYFITYLLLTNPNAEPATATITYLPLFGAPVVREHVVQPGQRLTLNIALEDATLVSAAIGAQVTSDRPIVAERAQYWPQPTWNEGHTSPGVTAAGLRWGLADGRVGGAADHQTYILLANPGTQAAEATLTFLRTNGTTVVKTFAVPASSRINVAVNGPASDVPELANESFGTVISSTQPIVVERSLYSNANGIIWAAGTSATGTRLADPR